MNFEFCTKEAFSKGQALIAAGSVKDGVASLLEARDEYAQRDMRDGTNCSGVINEAIKRLQDDPYMTLGLPNSCSPTEIKKAYRKLALKYHPDKNSATSLLFTVIQDSYDTLSDEEKRSAYDIRRRRQEASMEKLRKQRPAPAQNQSRNQHQRPNSAKKRNGHNPDPKASADGAGSGGGGGRPSYQHAHNFRGYRTNKSQQQQTRQSPRPQPDPTPDPSRRYSRPMPEPRKEPWVHENQKNEAEERGEEVKRAAEKLRQKNREADTAAEKLRQFNKKFYREFRQNAKGGSSNGTNSRPSTASNGNDPKYKQASGMGDKSKPQAPSKPKNLRFTHRDDTTVTLCWESDAVAGHNVAYELQWRQRGKSIMEWNTSPTLIVSNSCRKKNLEPGLCYEFRIRAASAYGWSGYSESVKVMTCEKGNNDRSSMKERAAAAAERRRGSTTTPRPDSRPNTARTEKDDGEGVKRTGSWAWRRDGEEGGDGAPPGSNGRTPKNQDGRGRGFDAKSEAGNGGQTRTTYAPWNCVVCKRANSAEHDACTVCFTKKNYKPKARQQRKTAESPKAKSGGGGAGKPTASNYASEARKASARPQTVAGTPTSQSRFEAVAKSERPWWEVEEEQDKKKRGVMEEEVEETVPRGPSIRVSSTPKNSSAHKASSPVHRRGQSPTRAEEVETDEEYEEEDTWEYDEEVDTTFESYDSGKRKNTPRGANMKSTQGRVAPDSGMASDESKTGSYLLNVSETRLHNVRREPFFESPVIGHLLTEKVIESVAVCGDWLKVKYHRAYEAGGGLDENFGEEKKREGESDYGWCLRRREGATYLLGVTEDGYAELDEDIEDGGGSPVRAETPYSEVGTEGETDDDDEGDDEEEEEEQWYELRDDDGELYYFNTSTGASQWEPPKWFSEVDPISGIKYYVNTSTGEPQWDEPDDFVPCVREEAYSTPEAQFVKSMLSPKRSRVGANMFRDDAMDL
mmetsp:Transcript_17432/g.35430  ORF Transcript_17432/g.35430 Transcript_17432/m.35430 type:complete len:968 (-) Transcript_17432:38-2941(-)